jgi:transposase
MGINQPGTYPSDVTDEEWAFVLPYLPLCRENSPQRKHDLRTVFNAVRYIARTGGQWRYLPNDLPPWFVMYQQMQRWRRAGCFEMLVEDVRSLLREWGGRKGQPTAVVIDSQTLQSTPESGARAGYDGAKRRKGSKVHIAVDTLTSQKKLPSASASVKAFRPPCGVQKTRAMMPRSELKSSGTRWDFVEDNRATLVLPQKERRLCEPIPIFPSLKVKVERQCAFVRDLAYKGCFSDLTGPMIRHSGLLSQRVLDKWSDGPRDHPWIINVCFQFARFLASCLESGVGIT